MAGPAELMREIHRLRRFAVELQEQLDRLPVQLKTQQKRVTNAETTLKDTQDSIKQLKATAGLKESELKATHARVKKHEGQLDEATDKKAYDALRNEIKNEREACDKLEEEILAALAAGEEKTGTLPALEQALAKAKQEFATFQASLDERRSGLENQLAEARTQLDQVESQVPEKVRTQFTRITSARGVDGFAALNGRTCTACYTEITSQNFHDAQQNSFVICKSCGRIIYLPA